MKWNDLTMKERSDLMGLFLKAGVGSLSDMRHIYDGTHDTVGLYDYYDSNNGETLKDSELFYNINPAILINGSRKEIKRLARNYANDVYANQGLYASGYGKNYTVEAGITSRNTIDNYKKGNKIFNNAFNKQLDRNYRHTARNYSKMKAVEELRSNNGSGAFIQDINRYRNDEGMKFTLGALSIPTTIIGTSALAQAAPAMLSYASNPITQQKIGNALVGLLGGEFVNEVVRNYTPYNSVGDAFNTGLGLRNLVNKHTGKAAPYINEFNDFAFELLNPGWYAGNLAKSLPSSKLYRFFTDPYDKDLLNSLAEKASRCHKTYTDPFPEFSKDNVIAQYEAITKGNSLTGEKLSYVSTPLIFEKTTGSKNTLTKGKKYFTYLAERGKGNLVRIPYDVSSSTFYLPYKNESISLASKNSDEITSAIKSYVENMEKRVGSDGIMVGSTRLYERGMIGGIPGDTEFLTTKNRVNSLKKKLNFNKNRNLVNVEGEMGTSEFAHGNKEVDINIISTDKKGNAIGKEVHEIYKAYDSEGYRKYVDSVIESDMKKGWERDELFDLPIPKKSGGFYTDEEIYQLVLDNPELIYKKTTLDALGSYREKHIERAKSMMFDDSSAEEYIQHLKDMISGYASGYKTVQQLYPNFDFTNIEANKKFLSALNLPEEFASDENKMRKIIERFSIDSSFSKRAVSPIFRDQTFYDSPQGLKEALNTTYAPVNGSNSGGGGNNVSLAFGVQNPGGGVGGSHIGLSQHPITNFPERITNAEELLKAVNHGSYERELTKKEIQLLEPIFENATDFYRVNDVLKVLGRINEPKTTEEVSRILDIPIFRGGNYNYNYFGKAYKGEPVAQGVSPGVGQEVGVQFKNSKLLEIANSKDQYIHTTDRPIQEKPRYRIDNSSHVKDILEGNIENLNMSNFALYKSKALENAVLKYNAEIEAAKKRYPNLLNRKSLINFAIGGSGVAGSIIYGGYKLSTPKPYEKMQNHLSKLHIDLKKIEEKEEKEKTKKKDKKHD